MEESAFLQRGTLQVEVVKRKRNILVHRHHNKTFPVDHLQKMTVNRHTLNVLATLLVIKCEINQTINDMNKPLRKNPQNTERNETSEVLK